MINNTAGESVLFILGAGFNVDASSEAAYKATLPVSEYPAHYPLVTDLLKICFKIDVLPSGKSIEDLFQDSIDKTEWQPIITLYDYLMELDYYITPHLKSKDNNAYIKFLRDFPNSPLLTFNYDSLPEILLLADNMWSPIDGYGVPVQAYQINIRRGSLPPKESLRPVLHFHGSLCVYPSTYFFEKQPEQDYPILQHYKNPKFLFDPDKLGHCFLPFERIQPGVTYSRVVERVIAPIPNKAKGLKNEFIKAVYSQAEEFLINARQIIVIGYSFNQNDYASYTQLLAAIRNKPVLLVAPDADILKERLAHEHSNIRWEAQSKSFKEWVNKGYPGAQK